MVDRAQRLKRLVSCQVKLADMFNPPADGGVHPATHTPQCRPVSNRELSFRHTLLGYGLVNIYLKWNLIVTCAQSLEVLIVSPLSCRHDHGAIIFERSPGRWRAQLHAFCTFIICRFTTMALMRSARSAHARRISPTVAMHKSPQTPMQGGNCVSAMCKCVSLLKRFLSEYGTKQITAASPGLVTEPPCVCVCVWPLNSQNTNQLDHIRQDKTRHESRVDLRIYSF